MGEWIEASAKTTDEAVMEACIRLGTTSDKIEYEVLEKESRGFLGIGSRQARIRAKVKEEEKKEKKVNKKEVVQKKPEKPEVPETTKKPFFDTTQEISAVNPVSRENNINTNYRARNRYENNNSSRSEASEYKNPYSASSFQSKTEPVEKAEHVQPLVYEPKEPVKIENVEELKADARKFLQDIFDTMKLQETMEISFNEAETTIEILLEGQDMGILIGKRGQTLDSLQYLVSLVVNRKSNSYVKVKLDTENYRERRKETLENLAKNIAFKVKRTKRPVTLEPMNPYERRIIHSALQYDKFVETHSEGDEPYRKVIVTLKRNYRGYNNNRRSGGRHSGGNYRREYNNSSYKRDYENYRRERQVEKEAQQLQQFGDHELKQKEQSTEM